MVALGGTQGPARCKSDGTHQSRAIDETDRDAVPVPSETLHPLLLLDVPHADAPVLPAAREVLPVGTQRERPHLVRVARDVARWCAGLALALVLDAHLVEGVYLLASVEVPFDDGALFSGGEQPTAVLGCDRGRDREAVSAFCA